MPTIMETSLRIILGLVAAICLLGGFNLLNKGAMAFLPKDHPPAVELDHLLRFTSGIYFGMGFLLAYVAYTLSQQGSLLYFIGIAVAFAGVGRAWSIARMDAPGTYFKAMMLLEFGLGLAIIVLRWLRSGMVLVPAA
jgi:FtsH-binding integral membrane protein